MSAAMPPFVVILALGLPIFCGGAGAQPAAPTFRIAGVARSTRDGAPVAYADIFAYATAGGARQAATDAGRQRPITLGGGRVQAGEANDRVRETRSDASGSFSVVLPHAGSWRLTGSARGFHSQGYEEHEEFFAAVVLTAAEPALDVTLRLAPDASITGLVLDEAGEPVANANVTAQVVRPKGSADDVRNFANGTVGAAQTDDRGRYELTGLAHGIYRVRVQAQPWYAAGANRGGVRGVAAPSTASSPDPSLDVLYPITWFPAADDPASAQTIALAPGEIRDADIHLTAIPAIHLRIPQSEQAAAEDSPLAGGPPRRQAGATLTRISEDGSFGEMSIYGSRDADLDFGGLTPGLYELRLPGTDGRPSEEARQIEIRAGATVVSSLDNARDLTPVSIALEGASERDVPAVEFVDAETHRRISSGSPDLNRRQRRREGGADPAPDDPPPMRTVSLMPHRYDVFLEGSTAAYIASISSSVEPAPVGRSVVIGDKPVQLTLHLAADRGEVVGVAKRDGKPVSGAMVLLVPATLGEPGGLAVTQRDETNSDGSFALRRVFPGKYILLAIEDGWSLDWRSADVLSPWLTQGTPVEVAPRQPVRQEIEVLSAP